VLQLGYKEFRALITWASLFIYLFTLACNLKAMAVHLGIKVVAQCTHNRRVRLVILVIRSLQGLVHNTSLPNSYLLLDLR
jgi:hypothetical protein